MHHGSGWTGHRWAQPRLEHLRELLRSVHGDPQQALRKGLRARTHMLQRFSLQVMGAKLAAELVRIQKLLQDRASAAQDEKEVCINT
jgi:hypothetical protein